MKKSGEQTSYFTLRVTKIQRHAEAHEVANDPKLELEKFYDEADKLAVQGAESHAKPQNVAIKDAREIERTKSLQNTLLNIHIQREHNITTIGTEELKGGSEQHDKSNEQETANLLEQLFENHEQEKDDPLDVRPEVWTMQVYPNHRDNTTTRSTSRGMFADVCTITNK